MAAKDDKPNLEQLLSSYIDGTCSDQERQQVEQALQRDPRLAALHAELSRTVDAIRAVPSEAAPGHVRERILAQLERRALLGEGPNPAATPEHTGRRGHPTAWLGLLAAAMLVAGVGVTWWIRMHEEKAPMQLAMAPAPADERMVAREIAPQTGSGRLRATAGQDRAAGEASKEYGVKIAEAPTTDGHPPAPAATPLPPQSPPPAAPARPQPPVMADRAAEDSARGASPASPQSDRALAMNEQPGTAPSSGKPATLRTFAREMAQPSTGKAEPVRTYARESAQPTATPAIQAPPESARRTVQPAPQSVEDSSRSVGHLARSRAAPAAGALAAAPVNNGVADPAAKDTLDRPAHGAAGEPVPSPAQAREILAGGLANVAPSQAVNEYWTGGRVQAVQQLQVSVRDADRQVTLTNEYIRSRVAARGGRTALQADPSVILAADPTGWGPGLLMEIRQAPGVVAMQSTFLSPDSDPLARQAFSLAAEQQCRQVAHDLVAWASGPEVQVAFPDAPPIIPQQSMPPVVPMVIVLQPVAPAAASQPPSQ